MKKWLIGFGITLLILLVIGYLNEKGLLGYSWQGISIIIAAIAAPIKWLFNLIKGDSFDEIKAKHQKIRDIEKNYQENLEHKFAETRNKIQLLNKDLEIINSKIEVLNLKRINLDKTVKSMSDNEKKNLFVELFGE